MKLRATIYSLQPKRAFRIARPRSVPYANVFVQITDRDGVSGFGEASPNPFYHETPESVLGFLANAVPLFDGLQIRCRADIERAWEEIWKQVAPSRAAQCALDVALWDWLARKEHTTVSDLAFHRPPQPVPTFATLGLSNPEELPAKLDELAEFDFLKIKSDPTLSLAPALAARTRFPDSHLAIDANGSWTDDSLQHLQQELAQLRLLFLEQPFPPGHPVHSPPENLLLMADESVVQEHDLAQIPPEFGGFNVKLVKCGGLTPAFRMLTQGRNRGLRTMVGCMLESNALIAAGATAAQIADYADLDGAWLLADSPFSGWEMQKGTLVPPNGAGLGIQPATHFFPESALPFPE